jgi:uncharacterized protein
MVSVDGKTDLRISVAYSPRAGEVDVVELQMSHGATVTEAIAHSGLPQRHPTADFERLPVGIWGRLCERGDLLRDRDRVELYRPLQVDPKEARRLRQRAQGPLKKR